MYKLVSRSLGITPLMIAALLLSTVACNGSGGGDDSSFNSNTTNNSNNNSTNNSSNNNGSTNNGSTNNNVGMATVKGTVWGPGGDDPDVLAENQFPVPEALVILTTRPLQEPPEGNYCNKCVEISEGTPHAFTNVDGTFEIKVTPGMQYWLYVQKGEFRRLSLIGHTLEASEVLDLDDRSNFPSEVATNFDVHHNPMTTLPNHHDPNNFMWMPKIAVIHGAYEDMGTMFKALGFEYNGDRIVEISNSSSGIFEPSDADLFLQDLNELNKYNIIVINCGGSVGSLTKDSVRENLRQYVRNGGKLYVDDFSYDYAEQPWPEFLSFYVADTNDDDGGFGDGPGKCGTGSDPSGSIDDCNNWSAYGGTGVAKDPGLEQWLTLSSVARTANPELHAAWNILWQLSEGPVGECTEDTPHCENGVEYSFPKVWMALQSGNDPLNQGVERPMTVSWRHYCGRVLYTVYHTEGKGDSCNGDDCFDYTLLPQEKIMMYLIMEIQTCIKPNVVD